jgi:hypothetical protein
MNIQMGEETNIEKNNMSRSKRMVVVAMALVFNHGKRIAKAKPIEVSCREFISIIWQALVDCTRDQCSDLDYVSS